MTARRSVPRKPDQLSILEPPAPESTWTEEELCDELWRIQKKSRGRDAAILEAAILELKALSSLRGDLDILEHDLDEADQLHEAPELIDDPDARGKIELVAGAISVKVVRSFLLCLLHRSRSLDLLEKALIDLTDSGIVPSMFYPLRNFDSRPPDPNSIVAYKGALAGMMQVQQRAGMSRMEASKFLARNIAPRLAAQLSRKPVTARMIDDWRHKYGGKFAEDGVGRKYYENWSQGQPVSARECRQITERMAKTLPARKYI
jgi:hypothetical protein